MLEISLNNIKKSYGFKNILDGFDLEVKTGDKISLIGENGSGKTTILNIINKIENIDNGTLSIKVGSTIGYLTQQPETIYSNMIVKDIIYDNLKEIEKVKNTLEKYEEKMNNDPDNIDIINKYLKTQEKYMSIGGYEIDTLVDKVTHGLNIDHHLDKEFRLLSGGEQKRVVLASIFIVKPSILLLDEPTNHLDINSIEWLEEYLNKYNGTVLVVSHDRYFLDKVTNKTVLLENGKSIVFHGNYSKYLEENEVRIEREFKEYKDQQKMINAMNRKIKQLEEWGKLAYPGGESFFKRAESIRKRLEKIELKDKPSIKNDLPLNLEFDNRSGKDVLTIKDYSASIKDNILIDNINLTINYGDKVCLIGNNGCGKTTFIKRIIDNNSDKIKIGSNVKMGYIEQQISFDQVETILSYARNYYIGDESHLRSTLSKFGFYGENVFKKVNSLSGGEKVRLKLFALIQNKCNFIILDEPTNHLDVFTKENLEEALSDYKGTLLFISHDRYFINKLANKILYVSNKKITEYIGNYDYFINHKKEN